MSREYVRPYRKLRMALRAHGVDQVCLRRQFDCGEAYLSDRMMGRKPWKGDEMEHLLGLIGEDWSAVSDFFPRYSEVRHG